MNSELEVFYNIEDEFLEPPIAVFFDFDGVFTDNQVYVSDTGNEMVCCSRADGIGLEKLRKLGIYTAVISTESNPVVSKRCAKLNIPCYQNVSEKGSFVLDLIKKLRPKINKSLFVGNDENDIPAALHVDCAVSVSDGNAVFKNFAKYQTVKSGGKGAVREICDVLYERLKES
ncbi:HAD hydrolase family protein [Amylibacter sp.]|nr:HAD hydrolase family protein [Amylibacter sp.]